MDKRLEIIQSVKRGLIGKIDDKNLDMVCDVLTVELEKYDVTDRCTEVGIYDTSAEKMLKTYIATKRLEGLSENTLKQYWHADFEMFKFVQKPVTEITTFDLRFFLSYKRDTGVSNRSLDNLRRCYSSFFGWLMDEGIIKQNPCASLKQIKSKKEVKEPFSPVDIEKLKNACKTKRDLALVDFLYSTGCRVSEVAGIDIKDVDFAKYECRVLGKGNKERIVYLNPVAMMHLTDYLDSRNDQSEALFMGKNGRRLSKDAIEKALRRLGDRAGVENVYPHRFRRTLATNLLDRGMSIQDVATILGHSDLKTTQIYCYISQENVKAAYKKYAN